MCVTGWTWFLCPSMSNPFKKCKKEITVPCKKTRTSLFRFYVLIQYPDSADKFVRDELDRCHKIATAVAVGVITDAIVKASAAGPAAAVTAAIGSLGLAARAYIDSYYACLTNVPPMIRNQIKLSFEQETKKLTDWRGEYTGFTYDPYSYQPMYYYYPYSY